MKGESWKDKTFQVWIAKEGSVHSRWTLADRLPGIGGARNEAVQGRCQRIQWSSSSNTATQSGFQGHRAAGRVRSVCTEMCERYSRGSY